MSESDYSLAIFPYLKTSCPFQLGGFQFRSTDDVVGISEEQAESVTEIAAMLFLQNSVRIKSGVYAILPRLPDRDENEAVSSNRLKAIQILLAYCYSSPHPTSGLPLLHFESANVLTLTPDRVISCLVWPEHHTIDLEPTKASPVIGSSDLGMRQGYRVYRNFTVPFWVATGCRIYPPVPHLGLNISQDVGADLGQFWNSDSYGDLLELLEDDPSEFQARMFNAVSWFNRTTSIETDEPTAIIQLAIAFESLLQLPQSEKTDRFTDAISLLLGRIPRLQIWAEQFYNLRSQITHEGRAAQTRFVVPTAMKHQKGSDSLYHPILVFGRQVFQACLSTILFGERLAKKFDLTAKLYTNGERLMNICKTLENKDQSPAERYRAASPSIKELATYRYIPETGLGVDLLIATLKRACVCLLEARESLVKFSVRDLESVAFSKDHYDSLDALYRLIRPQVSQNLGRAPDSERTAKMLLDVIWHYTFQHYFWLQQKRNEGSGVKE